LRSAVARSGIHIFDITEATVKVHVKNLLKRLGFRSRLEAAVWAIGRGNKSGH
jgi:two-component system nitrate/nitrite response regulator NarL